jgi:acetoin utilization protein AcuB
MRVRKFMTTEVITVEVDTPLLEAQEIMQKHNIKRLPVMKSGKLVGFVTKHMLLEAAPSSATTLSMHELQYLISNMKVGDIMVRDPKTLTPDLPMETAIWLGRKYGIGGFPVVEDGKLLGIITESDMTDIMAEILGLGSEGVRITIECVGEPLGELREIIGVLVEHKIILNSIMGIPRKETGELVLVLRIQGSQAEGLLKDLESRGFRVSDVS